MISMDEQIKLLVKEIKQKKEISGVTNSFVLKELNKVLAQNKKAREKIKNADLIKVKKSKEFKSIVKEVRKILHRTHGQYQTKENKEKYLEELKKEKNIFSKKSKELHKRILAVNKSAKERIAFYDLVYSALFKITEEPKSILDIGSGINPVSFPFMNLSKVKYLALELSENDCAFLEKYFAIFNEHLEGVAYSIDITEIKKNPNLLNNFSADISFLWKVIEPLHLSKSKKLTEILIQNIKTRWIVVSFATKTISGKKMNKPRRRWFEIMLNRIDYAYETIEFENEIFYLIKK